MYKIPKQSSQTLWQKIVLTSITAFSLFLILTSTALAGTVKISDQARVLDDTRVRNTASSLQYPLSIYTVNNYNDSTSDFDQRTKSKVTSENLIVIAISTNLKRMTIASGGDVPLSNSGADSARKAFTNSYKNTGDYTSATISSINSLRNTLGSSDSSTSTSGNTANKGGFNFLGLSGGCLIGLIILGVLFFLIYRSRRNRNNVPPPPPYANPNYGQPYPPNNYGQNYPPNYGPQQGGGLNPWAAGGLGAAAGGLIGYELGKSAGEHEAHHDHEGHYDNNGGNFGGGSSGDFGGDFGGGSSGDFGGGFDSDLGGGSGGSF
jgi:hypothetical protein